MSRRIDLSRRRDDSNFYASRNTRPFFDEEEIENEETPNEEKPKEVSQEAYYEEEEIYEGQEIGEEINDDEYREKKPSIKETVSEKMGGVAKEANKEVKAEVIKMAMKNPIVRKVVLIVIAISLVIILLAALISSIIASDSNSGLATGGYYAMICPEITVIFVDKNNGYAPTGSETFPLEEYVAGVLRGEVLGLHNIEIYKEFAILARTYVIERALTHGCTVEASDRNQVFRKYEDKPQYAEMVYEAVESTKGQVILYNNEIMNVHYDAFCSIAVDDKYYTIKQQNQKIPRSWVDSQGGIAASWKQGNCAGNHGMGVSTWGSYYLITQEGYTFDEVLKYYLGDDIAISAGSFMSSIAGLEIKDTTGTPVLLEPLSTYLPSKGSSVGELNEYIRSSVRENGAGTRAGVVTAAVSLINFLEAAGARLPYYWGGQYQYIGVNPNFGGYTSASAHGEVHAGFDCSGFVSWAILNGGYNFSRITTVGFDNRFGGNSCYVNDSGCVGQPGDLINGYNCHVQMIVAVDEAKGVYYIAESSYGLVMRAVPMHSAGCGSGTKILFMDSFYNNGSNINYNY